MPMSSKFLTESSLLMKNLQKNGQYSAKIWTKYNNIDFLANPVLFIQDIWYLPGVVVCRLV